ncbi:uncharacterized protein [Euphorbia lathyris]|uniref:uncharacterized protein n=1 Tax=Euphorbia lathyris TaxID=212925 RepID=UPI0033143E1E
MDAPPPPFFLIPAVEQRTDPKPKAPAASNRGRKPSKGPPPPKKQSQRGMGVANLERLRLLSEINQPESFNHPQPTMSGGVLGLDQGFENRNSSLGPFWINPYLFGPPDHMRVRLGSNELSSMPKMFQHYDQTPCDSCCKKKKLVNGDECIVYNGRKEMSPMISGSDFQGLNLEKSFEFNDQRGGFGATPAFYSNNNTNLAAGGPEVVAVHRQINSKGRNVLMEYEFFPDHKNGTFIKESAESSGKAPSCLTTCDYSAATSNSVDLSLKLSF